MSQGVAIAETGGLTEANANFAQLIVEKPTPTKRSIDLLINVDTEDHSAFLDAVQRVENSERARRGDIKRLLAQSRSVKTTIQQPRLRGGVAPQPDGRRSATSPVRTPMMRGGMAPQPGRRSVTTTVRAPMMRGGMAPQPGRRSVKTTVRVPMMRGGMAPQPRGRSVTTTVRAPMMRGGMAPQPGRRSVTTTVRVPVMRGGMNPGRRSASGTRDGMGIQGPGRRSRDEDSLSETEFDLSF